MYHIIQQISNKSTLEFNLLYSVVMLDEDREASLFFTILPVLLRAYSLIYNSECRYINYTAVIHMIIIGNKKIGACIYSFR